MKQLMSAAMLFSVCFAGCASESSNADSKSTGQMADAQPKEAAAIEPGEGDAKEVALAPSNTKIQFVGNHTGDDPKPRTGHFKDFTGKAAINGGKLTAVQVDIKTESLTTGIDKLTNHLKSPDFFDVREHPKATFQSTAIEADGEQKVKITGDLTLLGVTKSISFPATVSIGEDLSLKAVFTIDRTQFGMDYGLEGVEKDVEMTVTVGK